MAAPRNTTYELIYHLSRGSIPPAEIPQVLSTVFDARDYKPSIQRLHEPDLRMWVERLDQVPQLLSPSSGPIADHFPDHRFQDLPRAASEEDSTSLENDMRVEEDSAQISLFPREVAQDQQSPRVCVGRYRRRVESH